MSVSLQGVGLAYPNGVAALRGLTLDVSPGEFLTVVGPSGSGKTTLLRVVAGLEAPRPGRVVIGGRDVTELPPRERDVAMVFQNPALYPHLDVAANLGFGLRARGAARAVVRERVEEVAEWLGLTGLLRRRPQTLSGGQRQRVAIGRAVARRPALFLFDEPLSALDAPLRAGLRADLIALHERLGATMIHVTHDQDEALSLGDRVAVLDEGRVTRIGPPREVYDDPRTRSVGAFLGSPPRAMLNCRIDREGALPVLLAGGAALRPPAGSSLLGELEDVLRTGLESVDLGVRPEDVRLAAIATNLGLDPAFAWFETPGRARRCEYLGHACLVHVQLGHGPELVARIPASDPIRAGDEVRVGLAVAQLVWFPPDDRPALADDPGFPVADGATRG